MSLIKDRIPLSTHVAHIKNARYSFRFLEIGNIFLTISYLEYLAFVFLYTREIQKHKIEQG